MSILVQQAIDAANAFHVANLTNQHHRSLPMPTRLRGVAEVAFMFCLATTERGVGKHLRAPEPILFVDATTGAAGAVAVPAVSAAFGSATRLYTLLDRITPTEHQSARAELFSLLDEALPPFVEGGAAPMTAKRLATTFERILEPPLASSYQLLGATFFAWLQL